MNKMMMMKSMTTIVMMIMMVMIMIMNLATLVANDKRTLYVSIMACISRLASTSTITRPHEQIDVQSMLVF